MKNHIDNDHNKPVMQSSPTQVAPNKDAFFQQRTCLSNMCATEVLRKSWDEKGHF